MVSLPRARDRARRRAAPPTSCEALVGADALRGVRTEVVRQQIDLDAAPDGTSDAYLRLHLLSHCLVRPNELGLDGIFGALPNVVWTSAGPCAVDGLRADPHPAARRRPRRRSTASTSSRG